MKPYPSSEVVNKNLLPAAIIMHKHHSQMNLHNISDIITHAFGLELIMMRKAREGCSKGTNLPTKTKPDRSINA
jgi:hypothetical protein